MSEISISMILQDQYDPSPYDNNATPTQTTSSFLFMIQHAKGNMIAFPYFSLPVLFPFRLSHSSFPEGDLSGIGIMLVTYSFKCPIWGRDYTEDKPTNPR